MTEPILFQEKSISSRRSLRGLLREEAANVESIAAALRGQFSYILIAARGTSDNGARYAQYLFQAHNRLSVGLATPSIFSVYNTPPNSKARWSSPFRSPASRPISFPWSRKPGPRDARRWQLQTALHRRLVKPPAIRSTCTPARKKP